MRGLMGVGLVCAAMSLPGVGWAQGEVLSGREAARALFSTRGAVAAFVPSVPLSAQDRAILEQVGGTQKYYGAIAYSPDEGLVSQATVAAANHHSTAIARPLALAECNAKRASGSAPCVIAADIVPRKYAPGQPIEMSFDATEGFEALFRKAKRPRAFALSQGTGLWGTGGSDKAALAACGVADCKIVARD